MTELFFKAQLAWARPDSGHILARLPKARHLFVTLCMMANTTDGTQPITQGDCLKAGQLATSLDQLVEWTALTKKEVRVALRQLEEGTLVGTLKGTRGTVITICNWRELCGLNSEQGTPEGTILESSLTSVRDIPPRPEKVSKASPGHRELAEKWKAYTVSKKPNLKVNVEEYAEAIRKLDALDGHSLQRLGDMLKFVAGDDFWWDKALSPVALRTKSSNGLPKVENVLNAMRRSGYISAEEKRAAMLAQLGPEYKPRSLG